MDLEQKILAYCDEYNIPVHYLFEILEDQKVVPMIRGKATEYNAYIYLQEHLDKFTWDVQKTVDIHPPKTGISVHFSCSLP